MARVDKAITAENADWTFEGIADDFDSHVRQSVPLYDEGHDLVCMLSDFFLPPDPVVVELGTATGVLAEKFLRHNLRRSDLRYIAVDRVASMLERGEGRCEGDPRIQFVNEDIVTYEIPTNSMTISYYTMQFIHPRVRQDVFNKIYESLEWGAAFVLFEKVRGPDARFQDLSAQLYHEFKLKQGFDEVEILNKQRSLKGVLEPFSMKGNYQLLKRAGFTDMFTISKWVCFEGIVAIK